MADHRPTYKKKRLLTKPLDRCSLRGEHGENFGISIATEYNLIENRLQQDGRIGEKHPRSHCGRLRRILLKCWFLITEIASPQDFSVNYARCFEAPIKHCPKKLFRELRKIITCAPVDSWGYAGDPSERHTASSPESTERTAIRCVSLASPSPTGIGCLPCTTLRPTQYLALLWALL